jgi:hypothetical protein
MNRFRLEQTPSKCAKSHCDKHVVKMITEEAQMLSTAHRILDGKLEHVPSFDKQGNPRILKSGAPRTKKHWNLYEGRRDDLGEKTIYKAVHMGHPCTIWSSQTLGNYRWAYALLEYLCEEYTHRYGKVHETERKLLSMLALAPEKIPKSLEVTKMPLAMGAEPQCINEDDVIGSYRNYYMTKQRRFKMTWKNRQVPEWFEYDN